MFLITTNLFPWHLSLFGRYRSEEINQPTNKSKSKHQKNLIIKFHKLFMLNRFFILLFQSLSGLIHMLHHWQSVSIHSIIIYFIWTSLFYKIGNRLFMYEKYIKISVLKGKRNCSNDGWLLLSMIISHVRFSRIRTAFHASKGINSILTANGFVPNRTKITPFILASSYAPFYQALFASSSWIYVESKVFLLCGSFHVGKLRIWLILAQGIFC